MNLSIEFDFDRKTNSNSFVWNLLGKCVSQKIHPDEKDFEKRVFKLLPENYKSKLDLWQLKMIRQNLQSKFCQFIFNRYRTSVLARID